jgi:O-methyltransferase
MKIKMELFAIKFIKVILTGINRVLSKIKLAVVVQMRSVGWKRYPFVNGYDYIRFSSMELVSREIYGRKVEGDVAELGVYRGDFASKINIAFPDRKLYLFDTFEGFAKADIEHEEQESFSEMKTNDFSDTSVSLVMKKMTHPENCIVKKGFFPDTAEGVEAKFAFVSIDCDLYDPILSGLKFFWQRLTPGGYIFVHEYNQTEYMGTNAAVNHFLEEHPEAHFFPLTDQGGSIVLMK